MNQSIFQPKSLHGFDSPGTDSGHAAAAANACKSNAVPAPVSVQSGRNFVPEIGLDYEL